MQFYQKFRGLGGQRVVGERRGKVRTWTDSRMTVLFPLLPLFPQGVPQNYLFRKRKVHKVLHEFLKAAAVFFEKHAGYYSNLAVFFVFGVGRGPEAPGYRKCLF